MNLVSPGHRSRTETIEGWADIFTRKGSKKRRQAKVKRPQKSTPLCYSVCVCVFKRPEVYFQLTSWLSPPGDIGCARDIQRPTEKVELHLSLSAECDHRGQHTGKCTQIVLSKAIL